MIRKLLLPLVAVALLGGCMTSGYRYGQGSGDYYYGAPSVEYRYYSPYGYASPYGYYGQPYGYGYAYPYGYHPYYYGNRYYYYSQPRVYYYPRPVQQPQVDPTPDSDRSHWRDLERLRSRVRGGRTPALTTEPIAPQVEQGRVSVREIQRRRPVPVDAAMSMPQPRISVSPPQSRSAPAPRSDGSALGGMVRRSRKGDLGNETAP